MLATRPPARFNVVRSLAPLVDLPRPLQALLLVALMAPATLAVGPASEFGERAHLSMTAYIGLTVTIAAWSVAAGRARTVRAWIIVASVAWTALQALHNLAYVTSLPMTPDALLVPVVVAAAGAYRAVLVGRVAWRNEVAVYLDAAVVTATVSAALIAWLAEGALADPQVSSAVLYAMLFVGIVSATLILDLAVLAELKPRGAYALLAGVGAIAIGFVARALTGDTVPEMAIAGWVISAGALLVAYGTATWNDHVDENPRYVTIAARIREILPLAAVALTPLLLIGPAGAPDDLTTMAVQGLAAFALIGVVVRQSLLLHERGAMLVGLTRARSAAERRTQQIAGLEAVGRMLAAAGPTDEVMSRVIEVIAERFGYAHVAVYVADGPALRLGAQRGYDGLFPTLDDTRGVVGRVMRSRRPELVRDVASDPDYLMADPDITSEICAPLLDGGEFLGVLDVESKSPDRLDDTDFAAVVAVADQLASAMALALRRQRLLVERNFTSALLDTVAAVIVVTDAKGRIVRFNPACSEVSGYSMDELRERESFAFLVPPKERAAVELLVNDVRTAHVARNAENDWVRRDGTRRRISWSNRPLLDEAGNAGFVLATGIDITERKQLEEQLAHRALHDALTGLPNRALLMDRLEQALRRRHARWTVGVLFIDLDEFKVVNDTLGHDAGDRVLVRIARAISAALRPEDTAARVGGDEFAAVLEGLHDPAEATAIAERVRAATSSLRIVMGGTPVTVNMSIGVATSGEEIVDAGELLRNADIAMYSAKASGGSRCAEFHGAMYASIVERRDIERLLSNAVGQRELVLHYQPIVALERGTLSGAEALLRWNHPERGLLLPDEFLRAAESTGAIVPIGAHVLREACAQMARWIDEEGESAPDWVSVNVSPRQFEEADLFSHVSEALELSGIDPSRLMIEITESLMMDMSETTTSLLSRLRAIGVRFAIDDFGSGYSSLNYLRRLPIDLLKIDGSFITAVDVDSRQLAFVSALMAMGETLGLRVLAEGIETASQHEALRRLGCELGQGHYLGRPVSAARLVRTARRSPTARSARVP